MALIANKLMETTVDLMIARLQANMTAALAAESAYRDDKVSLGAPKSYFIAEKSLAFQAPAVFVIGDGTDFRLTKGSNFINALQRVHVAVVVENRNEELLTRQAYRYQAVLHQILAQEPILSPDGKVKLIVKIERAEYGAIYTNAGVANEPGGMFRKEIWLDCAVEHYERLG